MCKPSVDNGLWGFVMEDLAGRNYNLSALTRLNVIPGKISKAPVFSMYRQFSDTVFLV
jgi:hypothetical protein